MIMSPAADRLYAFAVVTTAGEYLNGLQSASNFMENLGNFQLSFLGRRGGRSIAASGRHFVLQYIYILVVRIARKADP